MMIKLKLSKTFPKKLLHSRKSFLGIRLLQFYTVLVILTLKLYLGCQRVKRNVTQMVTMSEEYTESYSSLNTRWCDIEKQYKY